MISKNSGRKIAMSPFRANRHQNEYPSPHKISTQVNTITETTIINSPPTTIFDTSWSNSPPDLIAPKGTNKKGEQKGPSIFPSWEISWHRTIEVKILARESVLERERSSSIINNWYLQSYHEWEYATKIERKNRLY